MWVSDHGQVNGTRRRRFFRSKAMAKADQEDVAMQRQRAGDVWLSMSAGERLDAAWVIDQARKRGLTLRAVWDGFLSAGEAAPPEPVELGDAVARFVEAKTGNGNRPRYVDSLDGTLKAFARGREAMLLHSVGLADIQQHLDAMTAPATRQSARRRLCTFWSFAVRRGWVRDNPVKRIDPPRVMRAPPCILTVRQAARVMVWTRRHRPDALAVVALSMFAGIRPWEMFGVTWSHVNTDDGVVVIDAAVSKVRQRRIVHLEPAAMAWVRMAKDAGATLPATKFQMRRLLPRLARVIGRDEWPHDVFRHTAASYWIAHARDAAAVALELGNSADILLTHYRELVSRKDAARFWGLVPRRHGCCVPGGQ